MSKVLIVGGGLTGCTVAHCLAQSEVDSIVLERAPQPGGLIRSARLEGVLYEPHGSHIFHTDDEEVWRLVNEMTSFNDYRHRVDILVEGQLPDWPIIVSGLERQSRGDEIRHELAASLAEAAEPDERSDRP